jgi:hypothetical protein
MTILDRIRADAADHDGLFTLRLDDEDGAIWVKATFADRDYAAFEAEDFPAWPPSND